MTSEDAGQDSEERRQRLRRASVFALLAALTVSLAANAYLVRAALHYFEATLAVRLDPAGLKVHEPERTRATPGHPILVFFGDSRAVMWTEPSTSTGYRSVNRGISYQTTAQLLLRVDADVVPLHPEVVVIEAGVNDLKAIADFPERRAEILADCEANLARIVARCRQPGTEVVLVTVFDIGHVSLWRRPFWTSDVEAAVREVNAFVRTLAGPQVVLFDANRVLDDDHGDVQRAYQLDHLHLSPAGYSALNQQLAPLLMALPK